MPLGVAPVCIPERDTHVMHAGYMRGTCVVERTVSPLPFARGSSLRQDQRNNSPLYPRLRRGRYPGFGDGIPAPLYPNRANTASVAWLVLTAWPLAAMSAVKTPSSSAACTAASTAAASASNPSEWRSSIAALKIVAYGLAMPLPAMSGAEPWIGS